MASKHEREMGRMMYLAYTLTYLEQNTSVDDWSELSNEDQLIWIMLAYRTCFEPSDELLTAETGDTDSFYAMKLPLER